MPNLVFDPHDPCKYRVTAMTDVLIIDAAGAALATVRSAGDLG